MTQGVALLELYYDKDLGKEINLKIKRLNSEGKKVLNVSMDASSTIMRVLLLWEKE